MRRCAPFSSLHEELIVALDLELNQPSERIVQIRAVPGNVRTGEDPFAVRRQGKSGRTVLVEDRRAIVELPVDPLANRTGPARLCLTK
jgi:hypothetical protein